MSRFPALITKKVVGMGILDAKRKNNYLQTNLIPKLQCSVNKTITVNIITKKLEVSRKMEQ